jgi:ESS family glutamate:Na+ symporter
MTTLSLSLIQTAALGVLVFIVGNFIVKRIAILERFCIPAPVVGGLLFALIHLVGVQTESFTFKFNQSLRDFFMIAFFSTIGFSGSWKIIRQGGIAIAILVVTSSVMLIIQNVWGITIAKAFGLHPLLGFCAGSISLMGGVGSSAAFAPIMEANGADGGLTVAIASATFGLVMGGLVAGPVAKFVIDRYDLVKKAEKADRIGKADKVDYANLATEEEVQTLDSKKLYTAFYQIVIAMGIGSLISLAIEATGAVFPAYVGAIFAAAFIRNGGPHIGVKIVAPEIEVLGGLFLNVFLSMTIMSLEIWKLLGMAGPLLVILIGQAILLAIFAVVVVYFTSGRDYDSAVITAGFYGYAMGATPNAVASMNAVVSYYDRPSPKAFFTVPIVGGFLMDFSMAILIIGHMNLILKGIL